MASYPFLSSFPNMPTWSIDWYGIFASTCLLACSLPSFLEWANSFCFHQIELMRPRRKMVIIHVLTFIPRKSKEYSFQLLFPSFSCDPSFHHKISFDLQSYQVSVRWSKQKSTIIITKWRISIQGKCHLLAGQLGKEKCTPDGEFYATISP